MEMSAQISAKSQKMRLLAIGRICHVRMHGLSVALYISDATMTSVSGSKQVSWFVFPGERVLWLSAF